MVFVADDLAEWLVGALADAGSKKLADLVQGTDQERALRAAATAAIQCTAAELSSGDDKRAAELAMVVGHGTTDPRSRRASGRKSTTDNPAMPPLMWGHVHRLAELVTDVAGMQPRDQLAAEGGCAERLLTVGIAGRPRQEAGRRGKIREHRLLLRTYCVGEAGVDQAHQSGPRLVVSSAGVMVGHGRGDIGRRRCRKGFLTPKGDRHPRSAGFVWTTSASCALARSRAAQDSRLGAARLARPTAVWPGTACRWLSEYRAGLGPAGIPYAVQALFRSGSVIPWRHGCRLDRD
jgi:hypothetical protein